jgi:hypothetical protein
MNILIRDIILKICDSLCDYDRLNFLSITKKNNKCKRHIFFNEEVHMKQIIDLPYFNRFRNVIVTDTIDKLPRHLLQLRLESYIADKINKIPLSLTHLTLYYRCNQKLLDNIPDTITSLVLDMNITRNIQGCIPKNIKQLRFTGVSLEDVTDLNAWIPEKVTHLFFESSGCSANISNCIPKSVEHLEINMQLDPIQKIKLHNGLTHLTIGARCRAKFNIPASVTYLEMHGCPDTKIPNGVKYLDISTKNKNIPSSVTHLTHRSYNFDNVTKWVPSSVTHYECTSNYGYNRNSVPSNVTHLTLPSYNKFCSIRRIPMHVEHITYRRYDTLMIDEVMSWDDIPLHIKSVTIGKFKMVR